jgi:GTP-binding protein YchF
VGFKCGIVGLPNVGKSTLFNALTAAGVPAENYPFCTTEPHVGTMAVPDPRLTALTKMLKPERVVPAMLEFVDIAGLVKGASAGQGMGNEFLDHIRNVEAIAQVVRCFADPGVIFHESVTGLDPARDAEIIEFELLQKDLQWAERRLEKAGKLLRTGEKSVKHEVELYERMIKWLNQERPLAEMEFAEEDGPILKAMGPLTLKPMFYVANLGEESVGGAEPGCLKALREHAAGKGRPVVEFCAKLEAEVRELGDDEREEFRKELGLAADGIAAIVRGGYDALRLVTFYTKVGPELRAWTVPAGTAAPQAAGTIHTDFERGFIKAEVVGFDDFVKAGSEAEARKRGVLRQEGREYEVRDGDVVHFKFNV